MKPDFKLKFLKVLEEKFHEKKFSTKVADKEFFGFLRSRNQ